jgi:poly(3-hydroxybutyrate) depolymerase
MPVANTPTSVPETSLYEEKTITQTIDGSLVERTYRLRYPENLTEEQYPSLFFFHGAGGDGKDWIDNNPSL